MKKAIVLMMILFVAITVCACGVDTNAVDDELQGTWLWISDTGLMEIHYIFNDGEVRVVDFLFGEKNDEAKGSYEIRGKNIVIDYADRGTVKLSYRYENDELILGTEDIEFTKWY